MLSPLIAVLGRMYPLYSGNYKMINSRLGRRLTRSGGLAWCQSPGGKLIVPLEDEIGRCIYFTGDYDKKLTWLCRKLVKSGDTVVDVGANLGLVTLTLARCVGSKGSVHAFEPNPVLQSLLTQSLCANSLSNVTLHRMALGYQPGEQDLFVPRDNLGQGSFVYHSNTNGRALYRTSVERLSDIVRTKNLARIAFMKIDVEGFENSVLVGASEVLQLSRPIIVLETNEKHQPPFRDRSAIKTLIEFKYRFLSMPKVMFVMRAKPIEVDAIDDPGHDVIAAPAEKYSTIEHLLCR